jgi:branched-chain amino acid aminotransferase
MHRLASFNGSPVESSEPKLAAFASGALYGKGVFTTIAILDRRPLLWEKHWRRLKADASRVGIDLHAYLPSASLGILEGVIANALDELLDDNKVSTGRARITFFDEAASELWPYPSKQRTSLLITTADLQPRRDNLKLTLSAYGINTASPLAGVKSCNYLEKILALDEAKGRGFSEAIQLNENDHIASACMSNVFWLKNGSLFTPSLETGCLAGTTREFILENIECEEVKAPIEDLRDADEIFLTSTGLSVTQVESFDGETLRREPHVIMDVVPPPAW